MDCRDCKGRKPAKVEKGATAGLGTNNHNLCRSSGHKMLVCNKRVVKRAKVADSERYPEGVPQEGMGWIQSTEHRTDRILAILSVTSRSTNSIRSFHTDKYANIKHLSMFGKTFHELVLGYDFWGVGTAAECKPSNKNRTR